MKKLLIVYNTCGISGRSNIEGYISSLNSILRQDIEDVEVVVSACMNSASDIAALKETFPDMLINSVEEIVPVSVTFNDTVRKCVNKMGEFEGYLFIDSGIDFEDQTSAIRELYELFKSDSYGMVAARTDDDMGFDDWFNTDMVGEELFKDGHMVVPVGIAVNLHVQIFSNEMFQHYGNVLPDIFAGQCMESVFSFLCAAVQSKWAVHKDIVLKHLTGMDGPSAGFLPNQWQMLGNVRWDHMFSTEESILDIIGRGTEFGMGYEENQSISVHSPAEFDENGYCTNDKLKDYIRDNMFLNPSQFDYNNIKARIV
jgi:hypothetical protein|tara:strand:+ start:3646 stop:4584 length:939 start_codon:yes stop_codon:yes gene_type:complete